jgi:hypothetical protein
MDALSAALRLADRTVVVDTLGVTFVDAAGRRSLDCACDTAAVADVHLLLLASEAIGRFDRQLKRSRSRAKTMAPAQSGCSPADRAA